MTKPRTLWLALALIATAGPLARAADSKPVEPTVAFQLKSFDGIVADVKYFAKLANQGDQADQLDGMIAAYAGADGIAGTGIDTKRPLLAYAIAKPKAGAMDHPFAVMIPISDEKKFLQLLEKLNVKADKGDDGAYSLDLPQSPAAIYLRFANKYCYVSAMNRENLAPSNLVAPAQIAATDPNTIINLALRLDQIPDDVKQMALGQIETRLAKVKEMKPANETPQQAVARKQGIDFFSVGVKHFLTEGKSVQINWAVDQARDDINVSVAIDAKQDTIMSQVISALAGSKTRFTPMKGAAFHFGLNAGVPEPLRPWINFVIDAMAKDVVAKHGDGKEREQMSKIVDAVLPTLKAGELDLHIAAGAQSSGLFSILAGVGIQKGQAIESAIKDVFATLPQEQRSFVKLDAMKLSGYNLHQVTPPSIDADGQRLFGTGASGWAGFANSAMVVGFGRDASTTLETLSTQSSSVGSPLLLIEGSLSRLAGLDPTKVALKASDEVFGKNPDGNDRFRLSLEGGKELKLKASVKGLAIKFATVANEKKNGN